MCVVMHVCDDGADLVGLLSEHHDLLFLVGQQSQELHHMVVVMVMVVIVLVMVVIVLVVVIVVMVIFVPGNRQHFRRACAITSIRRDCVYVWC